MDIEYAAKYTKIYQRNLYIKVEDHLLLTNEKIFLSLLFHIFVTTQSNVYFIFWCEFCIMIQFPLNVSSRLA